MIKPVLIASATGGVGQHLVRQLLTRNHPVRALVRDVEKARQVLGPQVELMAGDTRKPDTLTPAMAGVRAVLAGYLVEQVSGVRFEQYIDEHFFQPLAMQRRSAAKPGRRRRRYLRL